MIRSFLRLFAVACVATPAIGAVLQEPKTPTPKPAPKVTLTVPDFTNATCPIMGKASSKSLYAETAHGRIYVCCKPCIKKIQKDPEKAWSAAYPVVKETANAACPVSGKPVDAAVPRVQLQGYAVAVCSSRCESTAKERSQAVLARANDATLVDLENRACPITGEEADANTIAVIDGSIVRFATRKARTEAEQDPAAALAKAKTIVTQQQAGTLKLVPHPTDVEADDDGVVPHEHDAKKSDAEDTEQ